MKHGWIAGAALLGGLIVLPRYLDSCSPAPPELRFTTYHNMLPADLAAGRLGVLRPHFRRWSLLQAYRSLSGLPLPPAQPASSEPTPTPVDRWMKARQQVPGAAAIQPVETDKKVPGEDYQFYTNCLADAFNTAAATLQNRIAQWGARSAQVAEWLRGQDQVFQNCSGGPVIPQPASSADKLLAADRAYQIAAARFYAGQYDEAATGFDQIAADGSSPWRGAARYVAARVRIRQGTIGKDKAKMRDAGTRLEAIASDAAAGPWRQRAEALLGFVRAQTDPRKRLELLGDQLMLAQSRDQLDRILTDYTVLWDKQEQQKAEPPEGEVGQWIADFQSGQGAVGVWRTKKSLPWLIAAVQQQQTATSELTAAARAVPRESPAWDSVTYYGILAEIRAGETEPARAWIAEALAAKPSTATTNLLHAERERLARSWTEFLTDAPRRPVTDMSDEDDSDEAIDDKTLKEHPSALDADSVAALNRRVPLALWLDATQNRLLPANLQTDIAQSGWVRAVVLGDQQSARQFAARLGALKPALAAEMKTYAAETNPASAQFAAVFLMLRAPGFEPLVRYGSGRETPVTRSDVFNDNWWMLQPVSKYEGESNHQALFDLYPDGQFGPVDFLSKEQSATAAQEWKQMTAKADNSVNYLCSVTLDWAKAHPDDPRVPQALHLAVEATHFGPSDKSSTYSRQAFDLLHKKYPNSEWTKKTKYWY